jgi:gamma-glutamylcyclotransferase (GGCT)/AIG2-like uncharacterized protein YtfP
MTLDRFKMYDMGSFPAVAFDDGGLPVVGELYAVDDATLDLVDVLEGYPDHYNRKKVYLEVGVKAWIYFYENPDENLTEIDSPNNDELVWGY